MSIICFGKAALTKDENTILVFIFWGHSQFSPYILITVNLVHVIFNLQLIWSLPSTH